MSYDIVYATAGNHQEAIKKCVDEVNKRCKKDGWKPLGGISVSLTASTFWVAQAIVPDVADPNMV